MGCSRLMQGAAAVRRFPRNNGGKRGALPYGGINRVRFKGYFSLPLRIPVAADP